MLFIIDVCLNVISLNLSMTLTIRNYAEFLL